jgi:hypothetical protein
MLTNSNTRLLITYDTQPIALQKADYINKLGLGGAMWWELDADAPEHTGRNLVRTVKEALAGGLAWKENELDYPESSEFLAANYPLPMRLALHGRARGCERGDGGPGVGEEGEGVGRG